MIGEVLKLVNFRDMFLGKNRYQMLKKKYILLDLATPLLQNHPEKIIKDIAK